MIARTSVEISITLIIFLNTVFIRVWILNLLTLQFWKCNRHPSRRFVMSWLNNLIRWINHLAYANQSLSHAVLRYAVTEHSQWARSHAYTQGTQTATRGSTMTDREASTNTIYRQSEHVLITLRKGLICTLIVKIYIYKMKVKQ